MAIMVKDLAEKLNLQVAGGKAGLDRAVLNGYCGDLLSEIMGNAPESCVWITVQGHQNIIAVAVLREMAAIVIAGGHQPDAETLDKAEKEGIPLLLWPGSSFDLAARLNRIGVGSQAE
ncbi:MAG: DRTGG domain-containing protein [Desulfococcaceae bacterium]